MEINIIIVILAVLFDTFLSMAIGFKLGIDYAVMKHNQLGH